MKKQTRTAWLLILGIGVTLVIVIFGIMFLGKFTGSKHSARKSVFTDNPRLAALIEKNSIAPVHFAVRAKENDCAVRGPLPDPACTPGAVFSSAGIDQICIQGYTKAVRNVSVDLKNQVYAEYGLSYPQPPGAYEADHLIPLELGGSNDIANLFPESAAPTPGFHEKDLVENYLNHEVCAGHISLAAAQEQIATNWLLVYNNLTPSQIDELKGEFSN